ncbi:hypothetical protein G3M48_006974 [Beauveria asiatica]|uniref:HNH nuclease domain-containing protein n=1 Tax=Beauveria asiatica TaxID=1069075 RepID=A0AAW0RP56_9HYPO
MASDASDEVNIRWRSLMALDLPPAPANLPHTHYDNKEQLMEDLATRFNGFADSEETKFGAFQLAIFSIASPDTIDAVQNDDDQLRGVGGGAKDLVKFFVNGNYNLKVTETVDTSERPSGQGDTPCVVESIAVEPTASRLVARAFGSVRQFAHRRLSSSRKPLEQPTASSEPTPDPQPSTRRGLRSLKRKRSPSNTTQPTVSDTGSSVVNRPNTVRPRRSPPTARNQAVARQVKRRDKHMCILTKSMDGIEAAHILPHAMNSTKEGVDFFQTMIPILTTMFGSSFTQRLKHLVGSPSSSDQMWNMLTLNVYLHQLYDRGHVGFRPVKITANDAGDPDIWKRKPDQQPITELVEGSSKPPRRQESSEDSTGGRSIASTLRRFSPVPSLAPNISSNSSIIRRLRNQRGSSDDSHHSSVWSRAETTSSHTTMSSGVSDKDASAGGRIEMQVVSQPLQFAMDPENLISEVGESETIDRTVGKLAQPSELRESETTGESVDELERLLKTKDPRSHGRRLRILGDFSLLNEEIAFRRRGLAFTLDQYGWLLLVEYNVEMDQFLP